jgi:tRNA dimethylallyltransferase
VVGLSGSFSATLPGPRPVYEALQIGIERVDLDVLLAARTARMFAGGLVEEVRELEKRGLRCGRTASRALGYAQVLAALDEERDGQASGREAALARAQQTTLSATRRFARRQRSWFRRDPAIRWLTSEDTDVHEKAVTIAEAWWNMSHH